MPTCKGKEDNREKAADRHGSWRTGNEMEGTEARRIFLRSCPVISGEQRIKAKL